MFNDALNICNRNSRTELATKFGMKIVTRTSSTKPSTPSTNTSKSKPIVPQVEKKQITIDRFILDSMLIQAAKKTKKTEPKEAVEKKKKSKKTVEVNV